MKMFMKILLPIVGVGISVVGLTPAFVSCTKNKSKDEISIGDVQHNNASALQNAYAIEWCISGSNNNFELSTSNEK